MNASHSERVTAFRALHHGRPAADPLVLPNVWDAAVARAYADTGFAALATPSFGISAVLGYADGSCPADEMFAAVGRIVRAVDVPVTADVERGYGLPPKELVERIAETGAVGCNLEDSVGDRLLDPQEQADWLAEVCAAAGGALFVNARVDSFVRAAADPVADALARARLYVAAGAECVYPIAAPPSAISTLAAELSVPVNAICAGGPVAALPLHGALAEAAGDRPGPRELGEAGATRVTFGGALFLLDQLAVRRVAEELRGGPGGAQRH